MTDLLKKENNKKLLEYTRLFINNKESRYTYSTIKYTMFLLIFCFD